MPSSQTSPIVQNPFFDEKYNGHVLMYAHSEDQLPKIVKETSSFVLPCDPITVSAGSVADIRTGLTLIRKPTG